MKTKNQGYILAVVLMTTMLLMLIVGSLFELINTQRKLSIRKEDLLQANNAAESAIDYAYSAIINDINTNTINGADWVPKTAGTYKQFTFSSTALGFLTGSPVMESGYAGKISTITYSNPIVRILPAGENKRFFVNSADPANAGSPVMNQWVNQRLVPIVAQATATQNGKSYTAFVQKSIASQEINLFQYSIFFQGQLHMHRGFRPMGDVHTNGMLFLNAHDGDGATYNGAVSATGYIYRGSTFDGGGTGSNGYGYVPVTTDGDADFSTSRSPVVVPKATGLTSPDLRILVAKTTGYAQYVNKDYHTVPATWKKWATDTFAGNLQDKSHDVPDITLVGAAGYQQDVESTTDKNEFNNGPYKLLEPTFPSSSTYDSLRMKDNSNNIEANASLILIVEYNSGQLVAGAPVADAAATPIFLHRRDNGKYVEVRNGKVYSIEAGATAGEAVGDRPILASYSDPWRMFVVKGYRVKAGWSPSDNSMKDVHDYLTAITLPEKVFGAANDDVTSIQTDFRMEDFEVKLSGAYALASSMTTPITPGNASITNANRTTINTDNNLVVKILKGLFDSRLGRGVAPLTIDLDALKDIMEAPIANFANPSKNLDFRGDFDPTAPTGVNKKWNGLIYIEFPTSLALTATTNDKNDIRSLRFAYSSTPELQHPDRSTNIITTASTERKDNIVPFAPELRRYPSANADLNSTILDAQYAIPAVQLINGRSLPHPNVPANAADNTEGFSIATNVPVYVVGNYNSDGDFTTGSNIASDVPNTFAVGETNPVEIPAAIFCDTFTVLSNGWGKIDATSLLSNRHNSFYGRNNGSTNGNGTTVGKVGSPPGRPAKSLLKTEHPAAYHFKTMASDKSTFYNSNPTTGVSARPYVEISACIATGEYPIFEFFTHALESYEPMYSAMGTTKANPIIFKGSLVGMFHSEIQHIKQAYGRSIANNVQTSGDPSGDIWQQHGAYAIAGSRYHQFLADGVFPPGTPKAYLTAQKEFSLLHWSDSTDATVLTAAGFSAP